MKLEVSQNVPLTPWEDGTIRITRTRVTLDVIINQFKLGATAEQIYDSFPAASLKDIYGAIYGTFHETAKVVNSLFGEIWRIAASGSTNCQLEFERCPIYYYLDHTDAVEAYMREQQQAAAETRQWVESQSGNRVLRERLLARRQRLAQG